MLPETGLTFPLKADYERVNQALFDVSVFNNDEDALTMAHPFDGPGRGLRDLEADGHMPAAVFPPPPRVEEVPEEAPVPGPEPEAPIEPPPLDQKEIDKKFNRQTFDHVRVGQPKDGNIYVNDDGMKVKLDTRGHQYSCDLEGVRNSMNSARLSDIDPAVWKKMGPQRARLAEQAKKAAEAAVPPVDQDGLQLVGSKKTKKVSPLPQQAPVEGSLIKLDVASTSHSRPNAGGASSFSNAACHLQKAMPAVDEHSSSSESSKSDDEDEAPSPSRIHTPTCSCVYCIIGREGRSDDEVVVYNQFGSVYD